MQNLVKGGSFPISSDIATRCSNFSTVFLWLILSDSKPIILNFNQFGVCLAFEQNEGVKPVRSIRVKS